MNSLGNNEHQTFQEADYGLHDHLEVSDGDVGIHQQNVVNHIHLASQLPLIPEEYRSHDDQKPLLLVDHETGDRFLYALQPMKHSVFFILIVELLERFTFYGYYYTLTLFLTGVLSPDWNPGFTAVKASSYVSASTMVAYTTPFVGAFLADRLGDYKAILVGLMGFYIPGIFLMTLTTFPVLCYGRAFPTTLLAIAMLVLWPLGTGCLKALINVFGAKQFHPLLQSSMIESYYVQFYMTINVGALVGVCTIPILAQRVANLSLAYCVPLGLLIIGLVVFLAGTNRYVPSPPNHKDTSPVATTAIRTTTAAAAAGETPSTTRTALQLGQQPNNKTVSLLSTFRICLLIVPFAIGYSQMPTTFIVQGAVMKSAFGIISVANMNVFVAGSVLFCGAWTSSYLYPTLAEKGVKLSTTHKFAIGSTLGALAMLWALVVEHWIHQAYLTDGSQISVLWQAPSYILIGCGEIFATSSAYAVAFTASGPRNKAFASATNIFCIGGLPNLFCIGLYQVCSPWFRNHLDGTTDISHIDTYTTAHVGNYFSILLLIMMLGIGINLRPSVRIFVHSIEEDATAALGDQKTTSTVVLDMEREGREEMFPMLDNKTVV
mmetsp:Transcript_10278/g.18760  ORF Transcript_10278/g.18760 Transcript_10278/m.18760 type:complete len:604 (-) Transcript_10278:191-2002(-)